MSSEVTFTVLEFTDLEIVLVFAKLLLVDDVFFFGFDFEIRARVGHAQQRIPLGLERRTNAHAVGLIDLAF